MEVFVDDYIAKVVRLERAVGHKVHYRILEPFLLALGSGSDKYVEIQIAAKKIADFVGLAGLTFLIEPVPLGTGTCGRIELRAGSSDVFVQLSPDLFGFPEAILATLSHEISHKFLHVNGLSWGTGQADHYHNEVLTDITAVFLGLGKLMLNGRHAERVVTAADGMTKHTREVGYLDASQLAFVYLFVCHMRSCAQGDFMDGLNSSSVYSVAQILSTFRPYFRTDLRSEAVVQAIRERCSLRLGETRRHNEVFVKEVQELRQILKAAEVTSSDRAKAQTDAIVSALEDLEGSLDPCLAYISALRLDQLSQRPIPDMQRALRGVRSAISNMDNANLHLNARGMSSTSLLSRMARRFFRPR